MAAGVKINWSDDMIDFIKSSFGKLTAREMSSHLNISIQAVRDKYRELGFSAMVLEYWTKEQIIFLKEKYQEIGDVELATIFQNKWPKQKLWTKKHIEKKRNYLSLHRSKEQIQKIRWGNYHKGLMHAPSRFVDTEIAEEGEIRFWKQQSGRVIPRIKINGVFTDWGKWRWEQEYGPIDKGENVVFKGDTAILELDNLEVLTNLGMQQKMIQGAVNLNDKYIVGMLARGQPELKEAIATCPAIIELKRNQLLLKRTVKNVRKRK